MTNLGHPLSENLVVVDMTDGNADTTTVHLPATRGRDRSGKHFTDYDFAPTTWSSMCGQVERGGVYNHAGILEHAPLCFDCRVAHMIEYAQPRPRSVET